MKKIAVLVGSLRNGSVNRRLAEAVEAALPDGFEFVYGDLELPLFSQDREDAVLDSVTALKQLIESADGVLFVTPEYNRGYSGVIKNAIDWASRPWGFNSFDGKPAAIIGASVSSLGTTQAQQALRNVALYLNTKLLGQPEMYINASKDFVDDEVSSEATQLIADFALVFTAHINLHSQR